MEFAVVGPGAMGCLFAAGLKKAGYGVTVVDYKPDRAAAISTNGICIEDNSGEYRVDVPAVTGGEGVQADAVIVCVKSNKTRESIREISSWLDPQTPVLTLQNGLGNLDIIEEVFGRERALGGVTSEGAVLLGTGHAKHAGKGQTTIGPSGKSARMIVAAFKDAGFEAYEADVVENLVWGKLIVNVGINALTAITGLKNGVLPGLAGTKSVMEEAVNEAVRVAKKKGIHLPYEDPLGRVLEVCRGTSDNVASMLQDILNKRMTEVAFINGAIVREGKKLNIPTPVNRTLTCIVEAMQETYDIRIHE